VKPEETHFTILSFDPASTFVDFNIFTKAKERRRKSRKEYSNTNTKHKLQDLGS
jgi:hypothetical protein